MLPVARRVEAYGRQRQSQTSDVCWWDWPYAKPDHLLGPTRPTDTEVGIGRVGQGQSVEGTGGPGRTGRANRKGRTVLPASTTEVATTHGQHRPHGRAP